MYDTKVAAPPPPPPPALGYSYNNGGLTNQKLALFGLFSQAHKLELPITLPQMLSKDYVTKKHTLVAFHEIYDVEILSRFAARHGIRILMPVDGSGSDYASSWEFFNHGASHMARVATSGRPGQPETDFAFEFFSALTPRLRNSAILARLRRAVFRTFDIKVTAQFRIETDWKNHCATDLKRTVKTEEDYFIPYDQIVMKIMATLPNTRRILVFCDEQAMTVSKGEICDVCYSRFGLELFWKSDLLGGDELTSYNNLERSIIDFELAVASHHYVGLSRSTFSNMVTFEKYMARRRSVVDDYIYNCPGPLLGRRTDNGGRVRPGAATASNLELRLVPSDERDCHWHVFIVAHISHVGDVVMDRRDIDDEENVPVSAGVLGDSTKLIEGFAIDFPDHLEGGLEYRALSANGGIGPWMSAGAYAGTRGKGQVLRGFAVRLTGTLAQSHDCICIGSFLDGNSLVETSNGENCRNGEDKLVAMQIVFRPAAASPTASAVLQSVIAE